MRIEIREWVTALSGPDCENAWHSLREAGVEALPAVIEAYRGADDADVRVALVEVISEWRSPEGVRFLSSLLHDREAKIWKAALDGLVMSELRDACVALQSARRTAAEPQRSWFDEAIEQLQAHPGESGAADGA